MRTLYLYLEIILNSMAGDGIENVIEKTTDSERLANEYLVHVIDKYILVPKVRDSCDNKASF